MAVDLVKLLSDLVAIPSVNPMGRNLTGPEYLEHRVTAYLERWFKDGVDTPGLVLIKVHAGRIHYWDGEDEGEVNL